MQKIGLAALTAVLMSGSAYAADIYGGSTKDSPSTFESPGMVNWSGLYIGVQGGYGNANHNLSLQEYYPVDSEEEGGGYTTQTDTLGSLNGINSHGGIGGGRIGYDHARGRLLFGVFAEYNFTNMETELTIAGGDSPDVKFGLEKDDEWSVGGRIGYIAAPRTLVYALAAYSQTKYNVTGFDGIEVPEGGYFNKGATFDGVTVGGGVEIALTGNVFLGLEYAHTFYGEETLLDAGYTYEDGAREGGRVVDDLDEDKVLATLKFKLNGGLLD